MHACVRACVYVCVSACVRTRMCDVRACVFGPLIPMIFRAFDTFDSLTVFVKRFKFLLELQAKAIRWVNIL